MTIGAPPREAITACRDVVVAYGRGDAARRALDGVTRELSRSQSLALLGRSGSGKTTLLHVLGGLLEPTAGAVEWHARPLSSLDRAARGAVRAHGIAYVFQGANLLPHFNAFENVAFTALVRLAVVGLVSAPARAATQLATLALAIALLAAMLLFVGHSLGTMTGGATQSVPLDWQGPVGSYAKATQIAQRVARQPGVLAAAPVATAPFARTEHVSSNGTI